MTNLTVNDFDYVLPDGLIARYPLKQRSASRLLCLSQSGEIQDNQFSQLPDLLNSGDLIIFNDTKVMKARLFGKKISGGKIEVLVERILDTPHQKEEHLPLNEQYDGSISEVALCHIRASNAPKIGNDLLLTPNDIRATVIGRKDNLFIVQFYQPILPILEEFGELPIPPYFERHADDIDQNRYQTVFHDPNKLASVATPTASLHFDDMILKALNQKGIKTAFVTLHVGAGTFAPVKTHDILSHKMHSEYAHLPQETAELINQTKQAGGKIIAVGTTVTRVLETAYQKTYPNAHQLTAWSGDTDIFIYPSFQFHVIDRLITNFHLPKSTLLMLVSAFSGKQQIEQAYQHAIEQKYRFFSYGDAMLLDKSDQNTTQIK